MNRHRFGNFAGVASILCLAFLWSGYFIPERFVETVRPYGLPVILINLLAAVCLSLMAAITASKRWLILVAASFISAAFFVIGLGS